MGVVADPTESSFPFELIFCSDGPSTGDALMLYGGQAQNGLFISEVHVLQAREHLLANGHTMEVLELHSSLLHCQLVSFFRAVTPS